MLRCLLPLAMLLCAGLGAAHASLPFWGERSSQPVDVPAAALKPGQWVWSPGLAPQGPLLVVVNLDEQRGYVYRNAVLVGWATVSSGKQGHETPTGVFHTLQKDRDHYSSIYDSAAMPYTQRLTWGGIALHAGGLPGYPSSHGCVHLPSGFAEALFGASPLGMTVVLTRGAATPVELLHPMPISPLDPRTGTVAHEPRLAAQENYRWAPDAAPAGPLALVLSRADERLVVLRGGVEIGRARVAIDVAQRPFGTHAFVAQAGTGGSAAGTAAPLRWTAVALPGHAGDAGRTLSPAELARARLPRGFLDLLQPAVAPGTVLVVTDAAVLPQTTGPTLTVLSNRAPEP